MRDHKILIGNLKIYSSGLSPVLLSTGPQDFIEDPAQTILWKPPDFIGDPQIYSGHPRFFIFNWRPVVVFPKPPFSLKRLQISIEGPKFSKMRGSLKKPCYTSDWLHCESTYARREYLLKFYQKCF